jgi:hypothetical protein
VADNSTPEGRARNRRVVFFIRSSPNRPKPDGAPQAPPATAPPAETAPPPAAAAPEEGPQ